MRAMASRIGIVPVAVCASAATAQVVFPEDFNGTFPPTGWTVVNNADGPAWQLNTATGRENDTGGDGTAATIDSDASTGFNVEDCELISPPFAVPENAFLEFAHSFRWHFLPPDEQADVDISIDGEIWTNLANYSGGDDGYPGGAHKSIDLGAYAGQTVQIRFHYYDANWDWWWQVDNVGIIQVTEIPAVSSWGLLITALALLTLGTMVMQARPCAATTRAAAASS